MSTRPRGSMPEPPSSLCAVHSASVETRYSNTRARASAMAGSVTAPSGPAPTVRRMQRLRQLDEAECYLRCYGWRGSEESVRVLHLEDAPPPVGLDVTAERDPRSRSRR